MDGIVKLKEVKAADRVLKALLAAQLSDLKLSYRVGKILNKLTASLDKIENKGNELVRKHGKVNERGTYNVAPENMDEFTKEFMEFLEDPADITIEKIPFKMLEQTGVKISPDDMIAFDAFVEEPTDEPSPVVVMDQPQGQQIQMLPPGHPIPPKPNYIPKG